MSKIEHVLFVFAHQDDECAALSRISYEISQGHHVHCVYLTNGAFPQTKTQLSQVRRKESQSVLTRMGVSLPDIGFLGELGSIPDGRLMTHLEEGLNLLAQHMKGITISRIFCLAWEGGHPDHDASHLITLAFANQRDVIDETWELSFYHGYAVPQPFFRVLSPLTTGTERRFRKFSLIEGLKFSLTCWQYPSQRKTWIALFPEYSIKLGILRREVMQRVNPKRIQERPHAGPLLYEWKFKISYQDFAHHARSFIQSKGMNHEYEFRKSASNSR